MTNRLKKFTTLLILLPLLAINLLPAAAISLCPMADLDTGEQMSCCTARNYSVGEQYNNRCCCDFSENKETPVESNAVITGNESAKREIRQHVSGELDVIEYPAVLITTETNKLRYLTSNSFPPEIPIYSFISSYLI